MKTIFYILLKVISLYAAIVIGFSALLASALVFPFILLTKNTDCN
ncbi:hypothetical protein [Flavobacterium sp. ACAM 123]|nr:hypothetical protein [Flavobacterium sp. ACAM 123]